MLGPVSTVMGTYLQADKHLRLSPATQANSAFYAQWEENE